MKKKRLIGLLLTLAMLLTLIPMFAMAGPARGGSIVFCENGLIDEYDTVKHYVDNYSGSEWAQQHGISYSDETNTLELNNTDLSSTFYNFYILNKGEDFKIKVSGKCKITGQLWNEKTYSNITIYSDNFGSLELDGLQIDNSSESDPAKINIEKNVTVTLNKGFVYVLKTREGTDYSFEKLFSYKGKATPESFVTTTSGMMGADINYYSMKKVVFSPTYYYVDSAVVAISDYFGPQPSLNGGDDILVAMTEPDPSTIKSAGIQTYGDGTQYYYNEITEPLDASEDQVFALNITGSDVNNVDENNPAPANSFAIYSSNVFSEENLVANIENGMKDAHGTQIGENTVEPANGGGSGMLLMAAPVRAKAAEPTGYNVSVTIPAGVLKPENTYYFVVNRDMVTNEEDANSTNTDIVFKFSTAKAHVHTEKTVPAKEATCTEPGLTEGKVCEECGEVLVAQEETPALGHTEEVVTGKVATCTEAGLTDGKKCSVCGEVLVAQEEIPALGHDFKDGVCTRCGAKDPDYKPEVPDESANDLDPSVNGIVQCPDGRWAMYKNGKVDTTCTTIAQNKYGWWRVENGYVNFDAQGIYQNKNGWWKTTNGKVTFLEFGLFENENGTWRVENSKVNFKANSIYKGKDGWYKTTNGKVTFKENGIFQNQFGWWYVKNSKVDFDYTGIASNNYGKWYINKGKVDFTKVGFVKVDGKTYTVMFGKVIFG